MAGNLQTARTRVVNVVHFAEVHSCLVSYVNFGVGRDAHEGKELVEPSILPPNRVSQGEGVWKWSMSTCRCAVTKMMSLTTTVTEVRN